MPLLPKRPQGPAVGRACPTPEPQCFDVGSLTAISTGDFSSLSDVMSSEATPHSLNCVFYVRCLTHRFIFSESYKKYVDLINRGNRTLVGWKRKRTLCDSCGLTRTGSLDRGYIFNTVPSHCGRLQVTLPQNCIWDRAERNCNVKAFSSS